MADGAKVSKSSLIGPEPEKSEEAGEVTSHMDFCHTELRNKIVQRNWHIFIITVNALAESTALITSNRSSMGAHRLY